MEAVRVLGAVRLGKLRQLFVGLSHFVSQIVHVHLGASRVNAAKSLDTDTHLGRACEPRVLPSGNGFGFRRRFPGRGGGLQWTNRQANERCLKSGFRLFPGREMFSDITNLFIIRRHQYRAQQFFKPSAALPGQLDPKGGAKVLRNARRERSEVQRTLGSPKHLGQTPMFLLRQASTRSIRHRQDFAQLGVGVAAIGQRHKLGLLEAEQPCVGAVQEGLFNLVADASLGEVNHHLGRQRTAPRADGFDFLAGHEVCVEQGASHRLEQGRFARAIRSMDDIQTISERANLGRIEEVPPVRDAQTVQDHARLLS